MFRTRTLVTTAALLMGSALLLQVQAGGQEIKGQIKLGVHEAKLEVGKLYELTLESPRNQDLQIVTRSFFGGQLMAFRGPDFRGEKYYCLPKVTVDGKFYVVPQGFGDLPKDGTIDYVFKLKAMSLGEKPVLAEMGNWTAQDPIYKAQDSYFKDYKLQLKAGKTYLIDLVKSVNGQDPYLYLEGPDGKIVARDDDSGGDLNARIIYSPTKEGEYRIIATSLNKSKGEGNFTLTVQQAE